MAISATRKRNQILAITDRIRQSRQRHLFARQRRNHRDQRRRGGQPRDREQRTGQRRLVLQNQIEQRGGTHRAPFTGRLQEADWRVTQMK